MFSSRSRSRIYGRTRRGLPAGASAVIRLLLALLLSTALARAADASPSPWASADGPSPGPSQAIGGAADGCLAGGVMLAPDGVGYEVIHLSRRRNYGHRSTVDFVERLGRRAATNGLQPFYVGDLAQPRGGPMANGHAAHQNGLDVDIWFNLDPKPPLQPAARESVPLWSMVLPGGQGVDPERFGVHQMRLLRLAAEDPAVDRIFVHWTIKAAMCQRYAGGDAETRRWLGRLRPWYGHDDHFHVRLRCPAGSPACVQQPPLPPSDGCDASLDWWASLNLPNPLPAPPPNAVRKTRPLPAQCRLLIAH